MYKYDVIIIGAGASGLSAARTAVACGRSTAVFDMGHAPARKVMASGGGRCNITNASVARDRYFGENPDFVRGAIARVTPNDILEWMTDNRLAWTEKSAGQYFCATGAADVADALRTSADGAKIILDTPVRDVSKSDGQFVVITDKGDYAANSVIIATGGISFPTLGVSDTGYKIAKKFGHKIVPIRPALCAIATNIFPSDLAGVSTNVEIDVGGEKIRDSMLITHFGIGGPAAYRASVRNAGCDMVINLMPGIDAAQWLRYAKKSVGRKSPVSVLATKLPARIAKWIIGDAPMHRIADIKDAALNAIADRISHITIRAGEYKYHNLQSAEVVRGGVDTREVSSKTMESKLCPGLFFAGEVLDIAGDLGGFNLHWAWASGIVAGQNA